MRTLTILTQREFSEHPDDWFLSWVLARVEEDGKSEYVTYLKNGEQELSYAEGHYFGLDLIAATADYYERK